MGILLPLGETNGFILGIAVELTSNDCEAGNDDDDDDDDDDGEP
jgi:hypothetical protein